MVQLELVDWEEIFQQIRVWCTFNPFIVYLFSSFAFFQQKERAKQFMRDFDKVFEWLRETTGVEEINELKEYFVNEYPEIFQVECCLEEVNKELERITKHDKKIEDVEKTLLTSISMEPFTNYEGIENDRTLSTVQKIVLYQKAIDDKKRRHIYYATNQGKLLEKYFIQGRDVYKKL